MSCGVIRKQKYTDSTLLESTEAGKFEAVAITFKMDAKKNDRNEHEQKKSPLTSTSLCSRPHSLLFSPSKSILFLRRYWLTSIWQISKAVSKLFLSLRIESNGNLAHFTVFASMQRARVMRENRLWPDLKSKFTFIHLDCTQRQSFWNIDHAILDMG